MILIRANGLITIKDPSLAVDISNLHTAAFGFTRSLSMTEYKIRNIINDPACEAYGYVENGMLVGFFYIHSTSTFSLKLLESFCVAPWKRGKGIGSIMLKFILNKYSFHDFHLTVTHENDAARGLYRKFGFNETDGLNMKREGK